jgi:hypothetical protein
MRVDRRFAPAVLAALVALGAACSSSYDSGTAKVGSSSVASTDPKAAADWNTRAADLWGDIVLIQGDAEVLLAQGTTGDQDQRRKDCQERKEMLATAKASLLPVPAGTSASDATIKGLPGQVERIEKLLDSCLTGNAAGAPELTAGDIATQEAITRDLEKVRLGS